MSEKAERAVLAGGCFWSMQQLLRDREGVISTRVRWIGGQNENPTEKNNVGHTVGSGYRLEIFHASEKQRVVAEETICDVDAASHWPGKVVTRVSEAGRFWEDVPGATGLPPALSGRLPGALPAAGRAGYGFLNRAK
jgi:peptide-methionine (S)-S-oxide reductase